MVKTVLKYSYIVFLISSLFISCSEKNDPVPEDMEYEEINHIMVGLNTRADEGMELMEDITDQNQLGEGSILYISQLGTTLNPFQTDASGSYSQNLYSYVWYENQDADWDHDYNFSAAADSSPIKWGTVRTNGSVGNAFSFYAMYFPVDNEITFSVQTNQSNLEDFLKSDIMGAYHATSSLYTRLRFRLFHLMVNLKVTLYVPVYREEPDNEGYSGFYENGFQDAQMINVNPNFGIEWRANRSSDTEAPLTVISGNSATVELTPYMYNAGEKPEITTIKITDYYTGNTTLTEDVDVVYVYEFSFLFPGQSFNGNFLRFRLNTPGSGEGGNPKNYYFAASQLREGATEFGLTQGTLQQLELYLPRTGNETIVVGANIIDWSGSDTEMTVTEETNQ